jgi:hypothetical protein
MLSVLVAMPAGAVRVPLPQHAIVPTIDAGADARGRCAIMMGYQLGFVAMTSDEGASWRFARWAPALRSPVRWTRFHCDGDAFFGVTDSGTVARPQGDGWQIVIPTGGDTESSYRGLESIADSLLLGTGRRVWISSDRGATWRPWFKGLGALTTDGKVAFVAVGREVRRARLDAAESVLVGKLPETVTALGFDAGALYAGTEAGVYRSRDGGTSWNQMRAPPNPFPGAPSRFTFAGGATFVHFEGYRVKVLTGDEWSERNDCRAILPASAGFWLALDSSFVHVRTLDEKPQRTGWPDNPFPTVDAVGASGAKLVASIHYVDGVFVSPDGGRQWQRLCQTMSYQPAIAIDGDRLQLAPGYPAYERACSVPGFKTRVVQKLPLESCQGPLCVRWRDRRLLRSRDRGRTWDDLTDKLPNDLRGHPINTAAAAGREILLGAHRPGRRDKYVHESEIEVWRSVDDGATFAPWDLGEAVTAFAPGPDGWYVGTAYRGLWRVPFGAARAP